MLDHSKMMLGRTPSRHDARTIKLKKYFGSTLPTPSDTCPWHNRVPSWFVGGNDKYGNCVIVCAANMIQMFVAIESGHPCSLSNSEIIALSREMGALNGYNILDRLKWWRNRGMWSDYLWAYGRFNCADKQMLQVCIESFGAADVGVNMASAWQGKEVWDTGIGSKYRPGSWGSHSVPIVGYDEKYCYLATWGETQKITYEAVAEYCDEAYATVNPDWFMIHCRTPAGFDLQRLHDDLIALTGKGIL